MWILILLILAIALILMVRRGAISVNTGSSHETAEKHTAKSTSSLYENVGYTGSVASQIALAKDLGTDLLEMSYHDDCCPECAKYQGRVYSISGKDPRFPQLPKQVLLTGAIHPGCRHNFSAYNYYPGAELSFSVIDNSEKGYHIEYVDAIKYSNRPFVDDRTEERRPL